MSFLLDTNVVSEIRRGRDPQVRAWADSVEDGELHLSVLTLGEIRNGIERLWARDPAQADAFADWLARLRDTFAERVLPVDERVADQWGRLNAVRTRNTVDSLIAATAHAQDLTVVTRNTKSFEDCGVQLLNPWDYEPPAPPAS